MDTGCTGGCDKRLQLTAARVGKSRYRQEGKARRGGRLACRLVLVNAKPRSEQDAAQGHMRAAVLSHVGRVRASNQDAWSYSLAGGVFVVCDGVGGAAAGEIASQLAAEALVEMLLPLPAAERTPKAVAEAVCAANRRVHTRAAHEPALHGMGTTLVGLVLRELDHSMKGEPGGCRHGLDAGANGDIQERPHRSGNAKREAMLVHVGDSRAYRWRAGVLQLLTEDHSLVAEQVRMGVLTEGAAAHSPMQNVITRSVGTRRSVVPEVQVLGVEPGDVLLLCTDGLTRELPDMAMAVLLARGGSLEEQSAALVDAALAAGGRDNVTVLLVELR